MPQQFEIDDDVVELVQRLANPRTFEPFNAALRRLLQTGIGPTSRMPSLSNWKICIKRPWLQSVLLLRRRLHPVQPSGWQVSQN